MASTSMPHFPIPLPLGRFHFNYAEEIGRGGLGRVHLIRITVSNAPDLPVGSEWAVKRLNEKWSAHPVMRERFEREIAALKRMSHTNIVTYFGENLPGEERFYVMPIFANSVRLHISRGGQRGEWREIARLGAILAHALQYAHNLGFFHRDFKPDNLLFDGGGPIVIADWGLGYFVHRDSQVLQQLTVGGMGTEYYCSLEQWGTGKCDGRGDIYSLGMTLDEWVTGRQRKITVGAGLNGPTTAETSAGAQRFNALLRAMTQEFKQNRPASMSAVAAELAAAADS
jgi:serine/threonine-protein kinase PpkA